ncbi:transposase [Nonomuraea sp. NPDC050153]|uniref:transposase n=1 Tax=Nonomuraea sp. NPDC050153 TaxID=3364359 RepID=UPI0037BDE8B6
MPIAVVIDSSAVRAAEAVLTAGSGYDGGKQINGRERHVAVGTGGPLPAVVVTTALLRDRDGAVPHHRRARRPPRTPWCGPTPGTQAGWSVTRAGSGTWPQQSSSAPTRP